MGEVNTPRYNHERLPNGEVRSVIDGYEVFYPAHCNGHLGDLAFIAPLGFGNSDFVHFAADDHRHMPGEPYGRPLTVRVRHRLLAMRRDFRRP